MLTNMKPLLQHATKNGYAVPAFDIINMESVLAVVEAAEKKNSPLICMFYEGFLKYTPLNVLTAIINEVANNTEIPVAFHLDHGSDLDFVKSVVIEGFGSVMYDGSTLPYEENLRNTAEVVDIAHKYGVDVEAELGHVGQGNTTTEEREDFFTDPVLAAKFVERTGIDALAIAIGTAHGIYQGEPNLDFTRLKAIKEEVDVPLVLHGGSGTGRDKIQKAIRLGISKLNVFTDLACAVEEGLIKRYQESGDDKSLPFIDTLSIMKSEITERAIYYIDLFGSAEKAKEIKSLL